VPGTIQHSGNLACDAHAACGVLIEFALTGLGYDYFWHSVSRFLIFGHGKAASSF
jgi:serine protease inhibitor ecotin